MKKNGKMKRLSTLPDLNKGNETVKSNYGFLRDKVVRLTPISYQCKLFCNGIRCKWCNVHCWSVEQQAISGLYSTWVTPNILATTRPTSITMKEYHLVKQFQQAGITSIVNLQNVGEHANCGPALHSCGFSYDPDQFMRHNISHYNFGWSDFGARTLFSLLDIVKVLDFCLLRGRTAIHCHAGLGRTGVLICCYLIWNVHMSSSRAIEYVRQQRCLIKTFFHFFRPKSVQTKSQVALVHQFSDFLHPLKSIYRPKLDFTSYLNQQQLVLHGIEARILRHIPKIVFVTCERLLELFSIHIDGTLLRKLEMLALGDEIFYEKILVKNKRADSQIFRPFLLRSSTFSNLDGSVEDEKKVSNIKDCDDDHVWETVAISCLKEANPSNFDEFVNEVLTIISYSVDSWKRLATEHKPSLLVSLLGSWFQSLNSPPIPVMMLMANDDDKVKTNSVEKAIQNNEHYFEFKSQKWTLLYLIDVFSQLCTSSSRKSTATLLCQWLTRTNNPSVESRLEWRLNPFRRLT